MKPTHEDLYRRFTYKQPNEYTIPLHKWVNESCLKFAKELVDKLPEGRNLSICLTLLEDLRMRANSAIAQDFD